MDHTCAKSGSTMLSWPFLLLQETYCLGCWACRRQIQAGPAAAAAAGRLLCRFLCGACIGPAAAASPRHGGRCLPAPASLVRCACENTETALAVRCICKQLPVGPPAYGCRHPPTGPWHTLGEGGGSNQACPATVPSCTTLCHATATQAACTSLLTGQHCLLKSTVPSLADPPVPCVFQLWQPAPPHPPLAVLPKLYSPAF